MASQFQDFDVVLKTAESDIISSFLLRPANGECPDFHPGEYFIFEVPAGPDGKMERREYSISGKHSGALRVTIKREPAAAENLPEGRVSSYFHDRIQPGDRVKAAGPGGKFVLDRQSDRPVVLLSGGVGLTPLVAMAHELAAEGKRRTIFIHACENGKVHALGREIRALAAQSPNLKTHFCYRLPTSEDKPGVDYDSTGFITRGTLQSLLPLDNYEFYLCGPGAFMQAMYDMLHGLGVAKDRVKYEFFGPATVLRPTGGVANAPQANGAAVREDDRQPMVTFSKSGLSARWNPGAPSLLDFAEDQGLMPDFSCRAGTCESCKTRVLEGKTEYVTPPFEEPQDGTILLCCSQPVSDVTLDL